MSTDATYRRVFAILLAGFWCALCTGPVGVAAASDLSGRERAMLLRAQRLIEQQDYAAAEKVLQAYVNAHADSASGTVFLLLGNARYLAEKPGEALQAYRTGLQREPESFSLCRNCAIAAWETGSHAEAARLFENACTCARANSERPGGSRTDTGDCALLLHQAAIAWYQAERYPEARRVLEQLIADSDSPDPEWLKLLVHTHVALLDPARAQQVLERYLVLDPDNTGYWKLLANLRLERQQYLQAGAALAVALALCPQPTRHDVKTLADIYRYLGAPLQAARTLERIGDNGTEADVARHRVQAYERAHRYDEALAVLERSARGDAAEPVCLAKARLLRADARLEEALDMLTDCSGSDDTAGRVYLLRAGIACDLAWWDSARDDLTAASRMPGYHDRAMSYLAVLESLDAARHDPLPGFRDDAAH